MHQTHAIKNLVSCHPTGFLLVSFAIDGFLFRWGQMKTELPIIVWLVLLCCLWLQIMSHQAPSIYQDQSEDRWMILCFILAIIVIYQYFVMVDGMSSSSFTREVLLDYSIRYPRFKKFQSSCGILSWVVWI